MTFKQIAFDMFYVYAIKNDKNKIYIGHTEDLHIRMERHNKELKSKAASYTSKNMDGRWSVIFKEECNNRKEAMVREKN